MIDENEETKKPKLRVKVEEAMMKKKEMKQQK